MAKFQDIFTDKTSQGHKLQTSEYLKSGKYPIIDQGKEQIAGYTNSEDGIFWDVPAIIFGDHTRIIKYVDEPFFLGADGVKVLKCKMPDVDYKYLYYYLQNVHIPNTGYNRHFKWLKEAEFYIHPLDEQRKIAAVLDKISDLTAKRRRQLNKLDELVKSRFVEMFGLPDKNPYGWYQSVLGDYVKVVGGYAFKSSGFLDSGIPVLRIGNINTGHFSCTNMVYWQDDPALERYKVYPNDLVMSLTGTVDKDDYGNVCMLGNEYPMYYLNQRNAKLEIQKFLDKCYLSELLKFPYMKKQLTKVSRGVRQANISNNDILNLCITVPPIELQERFAIFIGTVEELKSKIINSLVTLETLKKSLMQEYFSAR